VSAQVGPAVRIRSSKLVALTAATKITDFLEYILPTLRQSVRGSTASGFVIHNLRSVQWVKEFSNRNWTTVDTMIDLSRCSMLFQGIDEENHWQSH